MEYKDSSISKMNKKTKKITAIINNILTLRLRSLMTLDLAYHPNSFQWKPFRIPDLFGIQTEMYTDWFFNVLQCDYYYESELCTWNWNKVILGFD